jgi:hypothetical protein
MNTYSKYCPNVFVAKCEEKHEKGDIIEMTTKYGQTHEAIVFNYLGATKDGQFCYSIVRADGYNVQERAKAKAERLQQWAANAEKKSNKYWEASKEGADFLVLAEPIKIGHHSEKRHRALIERNHNRMAKCVEFSDKSKEYDERSGYWEKQANVINLSMPESIEYFEFELEKAKERHAGIKNGSIKREHSFSLAYAGKAVKELESKLLIAKKLWA